MAKYIPKENDVVFVEGPSFVRYVVVKVNEGKETADVKSVPEPTLMTPDVHWSKLHHLDESLPASSWRVPHEEHEVQELLHKVAKQRLRPEIPSTNKTD